MMEYRPWMFDFECNGDDDCPGTGGAAYEACHTCEHAELCYGPTEQDLHMDENQALCIRIHQATPTTLAEEARAGGWDSVEHLFADSSITASDAIQCQAYVPIEQRCVVINTMNLPITYVTLLTEIDGVACYVRAVRAWRTPFGHLYVHAESFA